ncbi:hypothetical protein ACJMK2_021143, partial [Sinanodonta woodiana]
MNIQLAELIFCVMMVQEVRCHINGAPPSACSDMTPHHHYVPQSRPPPYSISVSKNTYNPGEQIIVTLQANSGVTFKGFLIQSRRDANTNDTVGSFTTAPGTKNTCNNQASLTQLDASLKGKLSVIWIAPSTPVGNVVFVATFVQNISTYWVKVQGPSVIPQVPPSPPPPPPSPLAITSSTAPKSPKNTNITITPLTTAITSSHNQLIHTTTVSTTKLTAITTILPINLSDTTTVSTTKLTAITTTLPTNLADARTVSSTKFTTPPSTISAELADTSTISTTKLTAITTTLPTNLSDTTTVAPSNPTTVYESPTTVYKSPATVYESPTTVYESPTTVYKSPTTVYKSPTTVYESPTTVYESPTTVYESPTTVYESPTTVYESPTTSIQLTTTPTGAKDNKDMSGFSPSCFDHGCGITKGCFHNCNLGTSWTFLVTWRDNGGESVDFEMKAKMPVADNYWVSLGLSDDKDMDTFGITGKSWKVEYGVLTCSFSRMRRFDSVTNGTRIKRVASSVDHFFDLDTDWYLFFAEGHTNGATIQKKQHDVRPTVSMARADFQTLRDISTPETGSTKESLLFSTTMLQTIIPVFGASCLDHGCGITKGCFHNCNLGASWTFLVTWKDNGGDSVDFEMKAKIPVADNYWVSLGLSDDKEMGNDSVMDCIVNSGVVTVHSSYNLQDYSNELLQPDTFGITGKSGKVENGVLTCSFSRVRRFDLVTNGTRIKRVASSVNHFFDLDTDWYLFFAKGHTLGATMKKKRHAVPPTVSNGMADFQTMRDISSPYTGSTSISPTLLRGGTCKDPACGGTKGCFHDCDRGASWTFLITWADTGDNSINFEMKAKIPGIDNYWVSIGLSKDRIMGDDSVMDCSVMNGVITVYNSYNAKNDKMNAALSNATYGIENKGGKVEDGIFTCSFSRLKTVNSLSNKNRKKRAAVSADTFFDLNEDWYLLFTFGRTAGSATSKSPHSMTDLPKSSAVKADLQSMIDLSASKVKELLIRVH